MRQKYPYPSLSLRFEPGNFVRLAATPAGQALWTFMNQPHVVLLMDHGVQHGRSPVAEISSQLLDEFGLPHDSELSERERFHRGLEKRFGPLTAGDPRVRQMIGAMARQILEAIGCSLRSSDVPARDQWNIFTTSARYQHPELAPGSRPSLQAADMREALKAAFEDLDGDICDKLSNWHVHGPSSEPGERNCNDHPVAVHKSDPHGILTFRDSLWPIGLLGAAPRPPNHNFGRMSLIADAAAIQKLGGPTEYAHAVVAELRRLSAW
jgi:hypothetical protein